MSPTGEAAQAREVHALLLRLAGRIDDEALWQARVLLAGGQLAESLRTAGAAVLAGEVAVLDRDADLLAGASDDPPPSPFGAGGGGAPSAINRTRGETVLPYRFAPVGPDILMERGNDVPQTIDAPAGQSAYEDDIDRAAVAAVTDSPGVRGLWRAWRYLGMPPDAPPPVRVYLVEADAQAAEPPRLTGDLQLALEQAGLTTPQIEVTATGEPAPLYQRSARGYAALLWASSPPVEVTTAPVFDAVDPVTGPSFAEDHLRLTDPDERQQVLAYLTGGTALATTTARMDDILDSARSQVVPMSFRTDGTWIWTDTVSYYLEQHELAPAAPLLEHIREVGYHVAELDAVALFRAISALQRPRQSEPVWTSGSARRAPGGDR